MTKAYIFDAFGTLFNLDIPANQIDKLADGKGAELLQIWRTKQLEYTWLRTLMQRYQPFNEVTKEALQFAMKSVGVDHPQLTKTLLPIYENANAFPEVKATLEQLKKAGHLVSILSNGTPQMLQNGAKHAAIFDNLDLIISVDDIKVFKPDPRVYNYALNKLNRFEDEVIFVSSNQWDVAGAAAFGLPTLWLNRKKEIPQPFLSANQPTIFSLSELFQ
ncbi:MAG: haloacid dehalogenase type II [Saprospiraceae bacterium]